MHLRMRVILSRLWGASFAGLAAVACAGAPPAEPVAAQPHGTDIELSELEIHANGIDRFSRCPPAGSLGQPWIPAEVSDAPHDSVATERAIEQTLKPFRSCYTKGTLHRSASDGRAAIVVRVGAGGKITAVENHATCGLPIDVVECLVAEASHLSVDPPASVPSTIVIPALFSSRDGVTGGIAAGSDAYVAAAHMVMESARPELHACEKGVHPGASPDSASPRADPVQAQGVFVLQVDAQGHVAQQQVEPWAGPNELKACASAVLGKLAFSQPPEGGARILARIAFNPRTR